MAPSGWRNGAASGLKKDSSVCLGWQRCSTPLFKTRFKGAAQRHGSLNLVVPHQAKREPLRDDLQGLICIRSRDAVGYEAWAQERGGHQGRFLRRGRGDPAGLTFFRQ
jgi:hypothetical protein